MPLLFSYGTLQRDDVQRLVFGRVIAGHPDELLAYEPELVAIEDAAEAAMLGATHYSNIRFSGCAEHRIPGTRFEITEAELTAADAFEGPAGNSRVMARLASGIEAWVYLCQ